MKLNRSILVAFAFLACGTVAFANAGEEKLTKDNIHTKTEAEIRARIEVLTDRIEEIHSMDRSAMSRSEKRALKKELKAIKGEIDLDDKITISVGAAIIILLLLILIL